MGCSSWLRTHQRHDSPSRVSRSRVPVSLLEAAVRPWVVVGAPPRANADPVMVGGELIAKADDESTPVAIDIRQLDRTLH